MKLALAAILLVACDSDPRPQVVVGTGDRFAGVVPAIARGEAPKTTSVVVMRRGEVQYEAYFGGTGAETLHDTRSVSKSMTALAVGIAIDRGVLPGVDAPVFPYLADLAPFAHAGPAKDAITIADFLTMSSALDCDDDDPASPGNEENMYPRRDWARWAVDIPTKRAYQRDATGRGPWAYCTAGPMLLGQVIQRAARQPVDAFMAEHLFAPLEIQRWQFLRSPSQEVGTGGGLRLRSRDLATIAELVRSGGTHQGRRIVAASFVQAALTRHRNAFPDQDYGYLFWHRTYHTRCGAFPAWFMSGNGGNAVAIVASLDAVIVVTRTFYNQRKKMHDQTAALIEKYVLPDLACPANPASASPPPR